MSVEFKLTEETYGNAKTWRSKQVMADEIEVERRQDMDKSNRQLWDDTWGWKLLFHTSSSQEDTS
jgi:hypothetical protein